MAKGVPHQPIAALNPYRAKWTIRAKVDKKAAMKSSMVKGEMTSILSVVLVDQAVRIRPALPMLCLYTSGTALR